MTMTARVTSQRTMRLLSAALLSFLTQVASGLSAPIVVSGATGRVGSSVVQSLLSSAKPSDIYVLVRDAAKARRLHGDDINILESAYDDPAALEAAFASLPSDKGFRLFLACSNGPDQEKLESAILRAAACKKGSGAGCSAVVKLSSATPVLEAESGGPHAAHAAVEQLLADAEAELGRPLPHAVLRPNLFLDEVCTGRFLGVAPALRAAAATSSSDTDACIHPRRGVHLGRGRRRRRGLRHGHPARGGGAAALGLAAGQVLRSDGATARRAGKDCGGGVVGPPEAGNRGVLRRGLPRGQGAPPVPRSRVSSSAPHAMRRDERRRGGTRGGAGLEDYFFAKSGDTRQGAWRGEQQQQQQGRGVEGTNRRRSRVLPNTFSRLVAFGEETKGFRGGGGGGGGGGEEGEEKDASLFGAAARVMEVRSSDEVAAQARR